MIELAEEQLLFDALSHETRRKIIRILGEHGPQQYTVILEQLGIETGVLNYHLGKLGKIVEKDSSGLYRLTRLGEKAYSILLFTEGRLPHTQHKVSYRWLLDILTIFVNPVAALRDIFSLHVSAAIIVLYFLAAYIVRSPLGLFMGYIAPLILDIASTYIIYGLTPRKWREIAIKYNYILTPYIFYPLLQLTAVKLRFPVESIILIDVFAVTWHIIYNTLLIRDIYGLDYTKSIIIAFISEIFSSQLYERLGLIYPPSAGSITRFIALIGI